MPQKCQVCHHAKTHEIDQRIIKGEPTKSIASDYEGLDYQNIWRHGQNHLPDKLAKAAKARDQKHAENVLDGINDLLTRTKKILAEAEEKGQKTTALHAIREARSTYELLSKIAVKLEEYRRQDEEKQDNQITHQVQKGLASLSTPELKTFTQLLAKIKANDPSHQIDPEARQFINGVKRIYFDPSNQHTPHTTTPAGHYDPSNPNPSNGQEVKRSNPSLTRTKSPRSAHDDPKNIEIENDSDAEMIDDLDMDLDDLDISKDNTIPSEETDNEYDKRNRPW